MLVAKLKLWARVISSVGNLQLSADGKLQLTARPSACLTYDVAVVSEARVCACVRVNGVRIQATFSRITATETTWSTCDLVNITRRPGQRTTWSTRHDDLVNVPRRPGQRTTWSTWHDDLVNVRPGQHNTTTWSTYRDDLVNVARVMFAVAVMLTYPVECFVTREVRLDYVLCV